ncbi:MAG: putative elav G [Streblomastix strix]|uniref:Putative elav G n=1 Tax=Streblomastix strix TaxID=222440 RepID=A0A5J4VBB9_9EUKA|nr:MAG: putative elav G [Streblomastix strix]
MSGNQTDRLNLFVKYLPNDVTDEELYELFSPFGEIVSSKVMIENKSGDSLGYGFVRFTKSDDADRAMTAMNNYRLGNKILMVKPSNPPRQAPEVIRNTNLYVKPLLPNTTEQSLTTLFSPYGKIVAIKVMVDRQTNSSRQIGFVRFSTQEEADAALHGVSGHKLDPSHPPLTVRYAETEEIKQRRMAEKEKKPLNHQFNAYKTGQGMNDEVFDQDGEQGMEMQGQGA